MKRGLRVKTGVRAPARLDVNGLIELTPSQLNMTPLVPLIRCTMPTPCAACWYCKRADVAGHSDFDWELPF